MPPLVPVHEGLAADLSRVKERMAQSIRCRNAEIQSCIDELLSHPGKLLRPSLVLLSARAVLPLPPSPEGQEAKWDANSTLPDAIYRIAAAVEILHLATLVHDDVIDKAETRRNRPSVFARHGARTAILVGDLLFTAAFGLVAELAKPELSGKIAAAIRTITDSEILQMNRIDPEHPYLRQYIQQIIGKTAVLFALSCRLGSEYAGGSMREVESLQRVGYNIGMAFQVIDDILDFDPSDEVSGKTPGRDLDLGILTLPVLHALRSKDTATLVQRLQLVRMLKDLGPGPKAVVNGQRLSLFSQVKNLVSQLGGFAKAKDWAQRYTDRAERELMKLASSEARDLLLQMNHSLLVREA